MKDIPDVICENIMLLKEWHKLTKSEFSRLLCLTENEFTLMEMGRMPDKPLDIIMRAESVFNIDGELLFDPMTEKQLASTYII